MIPRKQLERIAAVVRGLPVCGSLNGSDDSPPSVRYGDILLAVNGMRTTNVDDYVAARKRRTDGVELEVLRDGRRLVLFLQFAATTSEGAASGQSGGDPVH
jgi:S1-C subfamily serine protease